jgi:hypothetical protein
VAAFPWVSFVPQVLLNWVSPVVLQGRQRQQTMWFGVRGGKTVYALPGNPVSTALCLYRYNPGCNIQTCNRRPEHIALGGRQA